MQRKKNKIIIFYIITILFPVILLAFLEVGLRISNVGQSIPLFIEDPQFPGYLQANPRIVERYFSHKTMAPEVHPDTTFFEKNKADDTFRIFVQGGSTAAGFPYGRWGSMSGMLEQRFKRLYPSKRIEVISTSMAAVNTYTLLDFVDEIIEQEPDLILIYAGHNEYLGIMGVGSGFASIGGRAITLLYIKLRTLRLYQLMERVYHVFSPPPVVPEGEKSKRSLMAQIAKKTDIPNGSVLYRKGMNQFENNLAAILKIYQNNGIPVMIGNLVSNEQDQVPFSSVGNVDWDSYRNMVSAENATQNLPKLYAEAKQNDSAATYYKLGLNLIATGDNTQARDAFIEAKELDRLRFRAPREFNTIIARLAKAHGATLVDIEQFFLIESKKGIIGNEHMIDHLHPNRRGYFLLAEAFIDHIISSQIIDIKHTPFSRERAWIDVPITEVDRLMGEYHILRLKSDYPFANIPKPAPKINGNSVLGRVLSKRFSGVDWMTLHNQLIMEYVRDKNLPEAAKTAANVSDAVLNNHMAAARAAKLYMQMEDAAMALYYFDRAKRLLPN